MRQLLSAPWVKRSLTGVVTAVMLNGVLLSANVNAADYSPNFKGTEIAEFINIVGKNLKKTMIVDPVGYACSFGAPLHHIPCPRAIKRAIRQFSTTAIR